MEPGDVVGLSDAICKLLDDPGMARALGKAGQQHIRQILSLDNIHQFENSLEREAHV